MKKFQLTSVLGIALLSVTSCGGAPSFIGTWQREGKKNVTLEITKSTMRSGTEAMQFTANYSVVKVDGNKTTVKLNADGRDRGQIVLDYNPTNKVLVITNQGVFGGHWKPK